MSSIEEVRRKINEIDEKIIYLLKERVDVAAQIGKYKLRQGLPIYDPKREEVVLNNAAERARKYGLSPEHVKEVQRTIIKLCRSAEENTSDS
jgi:chorismate mutase